MADRDRLLETVSQGQRDVRFEDLRKLMASWDFDERTMRKGGHGVVFEHRTYPQVRVTAAKPKGGRKVNLCYVKECLRAIERVQQLEVGTNA